MPYASSASRIAPSVAAAPSSPHTAGAVGHHNASTVGRRSVLLAGLVALASLVGRDAAAQLTSGIDLGSRGSRLSGDAWQSQLAITPFARYERPRLSIDGQWRALGRDGGHLTGDGRLSATAFSPARGGFRLSLEGVAERTTFDNALTVTRVGADVQLSYRRGASGVWLGREVSKDNRSTPISPVPRVSFGGWRQIGGAMVTLSIGAYESRVGGRPSSVRVVTRPGDSTQTDSGWVFGPERTDTVGSPGTAGATHAWNDAQLGLHWARGRLALTGTLGTRLFVRNEPNEAWASAQGTFALSPDLALVAATGVRPSSAAYGVARSRFIDLGVRVAPSALLRPRLPKAVRPAPAAFELSDAQRGQRTIRVRIPQARTVELSGDFTGWKPVRLAATGADRWEATLLIPPGVHRVAIRVDGEGWTAPPGTSTVADEFQGTVGVIVVK